MLPQMMSLCLDMNVWYYQIPIIIGFVTSIWLFLKFWRHVREKQIHIISASWNATHHWSLIQCLTHRATCCLCRSLIVDAMYCNSCGVCLDFQCYNHVTKSKYFHLNKKNSLLKPLNNCKRVSISIQDAKTRENFKHHWVHGNIASHSMCFICSKYCEDDLNDDKSIEPTDAAMAEHTLYHYHCCWCQRNVHENCYENNKQIINANCDFGRYRRYIIPPNFIIHRSVWTASHRKAIALEEIDDFSRVEPKWSPLLVIANRKSGSNDAGVILSKFLSILNPIQVIDLGDKSTSLESSLRICRMLPKNITVRILVAGGDGTVAWVLNTIHKLNLNPSPLVSIFPLGTGNDLAKVLKWSDTFDISTFDVDDVLKHVFKAKTINLDRWCVEVEQIDYYHRSYNLIVQSLHIPKTIMPSGNHNLWMYNYFSIGVDALVALNFHQTRKSRIYNFLFSNTFINKFIYFTFGTKDLWERRCKNLETKIELELDGKSIRLPELESIVVLNIQSWGGGIRLLENKNRFDDSRVEVVGLTSTLHIGQVMMGLSKPILIGKASHIQIRLNEHLPMQIDGEPWLQPPCKIQIKWNSHAKILKNVI